MNKDPLISIIIPWYSYERLDDINELLNSLEGQIYRKTEAIFVVDRSPELYNWLKEYANSKPELNVKAIFKAIKTILRERFS